MPGAITLSEHIEALMNAFGISYHQLARALSINDRTVLRWLADDTYPQHDTRERLAELDALVDRLSSSFTPPEGARDWLHSESGYFGALRPIDALLSGRIDAVNHALEALDAGIFV